MNMRVALLVSFSCIIGGGSYMAYGINEIEKGENPGLGAMHLVLAAILINLGGYIIRGTLRGDDFAHSEVHLDGLDDLGSQASTVDTDPSAEQEMQQLGWGSQV